MIKIFVFCDVEVQSHRHLNRRVDRFRPDGLQGQGAEQTNTADMGGSTAQALGPDLAAAAVQSVVQDQSAWARLSAQDLSIERTSKGTGFDQHIIALSGGVQREVAADWHLGFGLGYERGWIEGSNGAESDVAAGVEMFGVGAGSVRLDYSGRFSDTMEAHAVGLRANVPF